MPTTPLGRIGLILHWIAFFVLSPLLGVAFLPWLLVGMIMWIATGNSIDDWAPIDRFVDCVAPVVPWPFS